MAVDMPPGIKGSTNTRQRRAPALIVLQSLSQRRKTQKAHLFTVDTNTEDPDADLQPAVGGIQDTKVGL